MSVASKDDFMFKLYSIPSVAQIKCMNQDVGSFSYNFVYCIIKKMFEIYAFLHRVIEMFMELAHIKRHLLWVFVFIDSLINFQLDHKIRRSTADIALRRRLDYPTLLSHITQRQLNNKRISAYSSLLLNRKTSATYEMQNNSLHHSVVRLQILFDQRREAVGII